MSNRKPKKNTRRVRRKKSFLQRLRQKHEFRPDAPRISLPRLFHLTNLQRRSLLKWTLYALVCLACLLVQDVIMSRTHIFGATTDLVVCAIFLITVIEGTDTGSLFVLIASLFYFFSGSAAGIYSIVFITALGVGVCLFRQSYLQKSFSATMLCVVIAMLFYELAVFFIGLFLGLTTFPRIGSFLLTAIMTLVAAPVLYPVANLIGAIGGEAWKE
jgi:hypothetical protein